ncbi:MAG: hypothetical protein EP329_25170 [Deltaproteobacteria bacterium]|nr:MAG: hypothetical protein EP329_25170 [Deltaproteobacteria bacterium]
MNTAPHATPFPARLADMEEVEARYQALAPDDRLLAHEKLDFYGLLVDEERRALAHRFPRELAATPDSLRASAAVRTAWDFRARELVVCMLQFGAEALARRLELVSTLRPAATQGAMALTTSGSIIDLSAPDADGSRHWIYRPGVRRDHKAREGKVILEATVRLGERVDLGRIVTSEVLVLAVGDLRQLGGANPAVPEGTRLFTPAEDTVPGARESDEFRLETTRFRVYADAMGNAWGDARKALAKRAAIQARAVQDILAPGKGAALADVAELTAVTGTRFVVHKKRRRVDLERLPQGHTHAATREDVHIGAQRVVRGAPLVVLDADDDVAAVIFEVTALTLR